VCGEPSHRFRAILPRGRLPSRITPCGRSRSPGLARTCVPVEALYRAGEAASWISRTRATEMTRPRCPTIAAKASKRSRLGRCQSCVMSPMAPRDTKPTLGWRTPVDVLRVAKRGDDGEEVGGGLWRRGEGFGIPPGKTTRRRPNTPRDYSQQRCLGCLGFDCQEEIGRGRNKPVLVAVRLPNVRVVVALTPSLGMRVPECGCLQ